MLPWIRACADPDCDPRKPPSSSPRPGNGVSLERIPTYRIGRRGAIEEAAAAAAALLFTSGTLGNPCPSRGLSCTRWCCLPCARICGTPVAATFVFNADSRLNGTLPDGNVSAGGVRVTVRVRTAMCGTGDGASFGMERWVYA